MPRLRPVPLRHISLTDRFWTHFRDGLIDRTLPQQYEQIVETGRLDNFKRAARGESGGFEGYRFNDSDVYKWAEACAYALCGRGDGQELRDRLDEAIEAVASAQEADGYLNTYFQLMHPGLKWRNLSMMHEMYCSGHLVEAGVALWECLEDSRLLDVAVKNVEHIMSLFGPDKRRGYCGHQELELALIRLSDATGNRRYRDFARWMIEERGKRPTPLEQELDDEQAMALSPYAKELLLKGGDYQGEYAQDHAPIREHSKVVGHAVRAMYFYAAAAELAEDEADGDLAHALIRIWDNLVEKRMYVTGGVGPSGHNEGFTEDYDLPNLTSYAETCASVGLVIWGRRMLEMTGDSRYADVLERALYNGAISGISLSGDCYFYSNPLESRGNHERVPWFACACCPPNIARLIGSVGSFAISTSDDGRTVWIHLPISSEARLEGAKVKIESSYPYSGEFEVSIEAEHDVELELRVRIPGWADDATFDLEGEEQPAEFGQGYVVIRRTWRRGDRLKVSFDMPPKWLEAHPRVLDNLGRVCLMRGPLVYCLEEHELEGRAPQLFSADTLGEVREAKIELPQGATGLQVQGHLEQEEAAPDLYFEDGYSVREPRQATFIPYFAWGNRGRSHMQVWLRKAP
jgi:uncharacterized protein